MFIKQKAHGWYSDPFKYIFTINKELYLTNLSGKTLVAHAVTSLHKTKHILLTRYLNNTFRNSKISDFAVLFLILGQRKE